MVPKGYAGRVDSCQRMKQPVAVLLAAGASRRFGRLKQLEPVGPAGEALVDYAIHDAHAAGFGAIVVVVRPDIDEAVRSHVGERWRNVPIEFAHQTMDAPTAPSGRGRESPWGTGHAVLAARPHLESYFAVANVDDFYGAAAWRAAAEWARSADDPAEAAILAYRLDTTLSDHGGVSRAVCVVRPDGFVESVMEVLDVQRVGQRILGREHGGPERDLPVDSPTSMNLWTLHTGVLTLLRDRFNEFAAVPEHATNDEFRLSTELDALRRDGHIRIRAVPVAVAWSGVTYAADTAVVRDRIARLVADGEYPRRLGADFSERTD